MKDSTSKIHLLYWAIIFVLLSLFLILCVPGKINEDAFSNFSFASVLVSIVLAVISIVLSLSIGQTTTHYNLEIKDIEKEIQEKLRQFEDLEDSFRSSIESIVHKEIEGVKVSQSRITAMMRSILTPSSSLSHHRTTTHHESSLDISESSYLCVASLYIALLCNKKQKPFPFKQLKQSSPLILGFLNALSTIEPDNLQLRIEHSDVFISQFSTNRWGIEEDLKKATDAINNPEIKDVIIAASKFILDD